MATAMFDTPFATLDPLADYLVDKLRRRRDIFKFIIRVDVLSRSPDYFNQR